MSESLADRKNNFRIEIRKKTVQDKISRLRANFQKQQKQQQINEQSLTLLFNESLQSIQKLIQNIPKLKQLSYYISPTNVKYFVSIISQLWYLIQKIDDLKRSDNIKNKNDFYNDLLTILINVSTQYHNWPKISYLPIIKNVIIKQRQINTLWFLSNLLYQKSNQNSQLSKKLTEELVQYDAIDYCQLRINKTFQQQKNIQVFSFYVCSFLSNSIFLSFADHKKIVKLIQKLSETNNQMIDYLIFDSMIDHAPNLKQKDYHLLYSDIIKKYSQIYLKKKKTKMVLKYLQFVKTFIFSQIKQSITDKEDIQISQIDSKVARVNYQRILLTTIPYLTFCLQNRSPQVKQKLAEICCMLLVYYFPYIDIENQQIFLSLVVELKNSSVCILCKYSNKALYWQIKYAIIFLEKIKQFKINKQIISQFISKNGILNALAVLLKQKSSQLQIIKEIIDLLNILLQQIDETMSEQEATKVSLQQITKILDLILQSNFIKQEKIFTKIRNILDICDKYT